MKERIDARPARRARGARRCSLFGPTALFALSLGRLASADDPPPADGRSPAAPALSHIEVTLKLDERLTRGLYLGDRWVPATSYVTNLPAASAAVEARARAVDAAGRQHALPAKWTVADPDVASVSPAEGSDVRVAVLREGETRVLVAASGLTREIALKALRKDAALRVEVTQQAVPVHAAAPAAVAPAPPTEPLTPQRAGYALGLHLGLRLKQQRLDVDPAALSRGLGDALAGAAPSMTPAEVRLAIEQLRAAARRSPSADAR